LTYEIAADVGNYLADRLDIMDPKANLQDDFFYLIMQAIIGFINALAAALGIDFGMATIVVAIVGAVALFIIIKLVLRRRQTVRLVTGF
jgi:hypothetical protein